MSAVAKGWYDDPSDVRRKRFWDGNAWTPMVGYPGATEAVYEPAPSGLLPPKAAIRVDGGAQQPQKLPDSSGVDARFSQYPAHAVGRGASLSGEEAVAVETPSRSKKVVTAAAILAGVALAAVVVVGREEEQSAFPDAAEVCSGTVQQIVGTRPLDQAVPGEFDLFGLAPGREQDISLEITNLGSDWPDDGRSLWDSPIIGVSAPVEWAVRSWADGQNFLVQRFVSPADAARWDRAGLSAACQQPDIVVGPSSVASGAATIYRDESAVAPFTQVSGLQGQYRIVVWAYGSNAETVNEVASLALRQASQLALRPGN